MDSSKKVILIADDVPENIEILGKILSAKYRVKVAANGFEALEIARSESDPPDLILLDIMMPMLDGYEVCRALKADPKTIDIPIIFLTALSNQVDEFAGLELGAIDFLTKPFIPRAIELRVQNHLALRSIRQELLAALIDLQEAREKERESLRNRIRIATEIQQTLLLGHPPKTVEGAKIGAFTQASMGVDGDFFDFFQINPWTFDVLFGDVMGKGIPAGLAGAAMKHSFQRAMASLLVTSADCRDIPSPEAIVNEVCAEMTAPLLKVERFVSLQYARFNLKERGVDLVTCGHTPLLRLSNAGQEWMELRLESPPLGMVIDRIERYQQHHFPLEPGDLFLFSSDGATEARNPQGEFYGARQLRESAQTHFQAEPQELLEALNRDLQAFTQSENFSDDLTFIAIKL